MMALNYVFIATYYIVNFYHDRLDLLTYVHNSSLIGQLYSNFKIAQNNTLLISGKNSEP